jgi:hypothetical protein
LSRQSRLGCRVSSAGALLRVGLPSSNKHESCNRRDCHEGAHSVAPDCWSPHSRNYSRTRANFYRGLNSECDAGHSVVSSAGLFSK